jgi:hypothetical protein
LGVWDKCVMTVYLKGGTNMYPTNVISLLEIVHNSTEYRKQGGLLTQKISARMSLCKRHAAFVEHFVSDSGGF